MRCFRKFLVPMAVIGTCVAALAQMPTYKLGRVPTPEEIRALDINVSIDGKGLPPGSGTAKQGEPIYAAKCAVCHGKTGEDDGPVKGMVKLVGQGPLNGGGVDPHKTIGNYYPFATTLWDVINRTMPFYKEGSLSADESYALTALLLYRNSIIKESDVMDAQTLPKVQMPNRNGFVPATPKYKVGEKRLYGLYP